MYNSFAKLNNHSESDCETDTNIFSTDRSDMSDSDDSDIKLEITEYSSTGNEKTHTYNVSTYSSYPNRKRLLCFSLIKGDQCTYGTHCTFAHTLSEQIINMEKMYTYQIILDLNLMNFFSLTNPKTDEIYRQLLFFTHLCPKCMTSVCMGGYNCKYGAHTSCLKICKNDLLTGECINKSVEMIIDETLFAKITDITRAPTYVGCINGHHLSTRKMIPYYTFINKKEASSKTMYQSVRYIDINHIHRLLRQGNWKNDGKGSTHMPRRNVMAPCKGTMSSYAGGDPASSSSTDDEINQWFKEKPESVDTDTDTDTDTDNE